eukprot:764528-Hanusia_phi.AAC.1
MSVRAHPTRWGTCGDQDAAKGVIAVHLLQFGQTTSAVISQSPHPILLAGITVKRRGHGTPILMHHPFSQSPPTGTSVQTPPPMTTLPENNLETAPTHPPRGSAHPPCSFSLSADSQHGIRKHADRNGALKLSRVCEIRSGQDFQDEQTVSR